MALDCQLAASLRQVGHVRRFVGVTPAGDPLFDPPAAFQCRCDPSHTFVGTGPNGEDLIASYELVCTAPIKIKDLVFVPGSNPRDAACGRLPKRVDTIVDEMGGVSHFEVLV